MELTLQWSWAVILMQILVVRTGCCVTVHFPSRQPLYAVIGQDLVLQAQLDLPLGDHVTKVTWERETGKRASGRTTVAEFPSSGSGSRVSVEKNGAVMKMRNYQREDSGVYTITVTDQRGGLASAHCTVQEYEAVHHVSVMVNVSHSSLHCREAWGTDPVFTWWHEQVRVTEDMGRTSADGSSLYLAAPLCGQFTCVVSNQLGHSSGTYTAESCDQKSRGTTVAVVCFMFMLFVAGSLALVFWRRHWQYGSRMERLVESNEDTV